MMTSVLPGWVRVHGAAFVGSTTGGAAVVRLAVARFGDAKHNDAVMFFDIQAENKDALAAQSAAFTGGGQVNCAALSNVCAGVILGVATTKVLLG